MTKGNTTDRMRAVLVLVATIATIAYNGIAATGYMIEVTPGEISDRYPTILTPANYAFSIWTMIYIGIAGFSLYQLMPRNLTKFRPVRSLYIFSCVVNVAWIYFWLNDQIVISFVLILALAGTLILILRKLHRNLTGSTVFTTLPFGIYAGWVTAASIVNFTIMLADLGVGTGNNPQTALGVGLLLFAAAVAGVIRWRMRNYFFPLSIAWAATAIAVKQSGNTAIVVVAAVCVIACLIMSLSFVMHQKTYEYR